MRATTQKFISTLEEKSGYMVQVIEEPNLPTLSSIRIAHSELPAHILMYKPVAKNEAPDYAICFQCALAIRMFDCPPEKRFQIGSNPKGDQAMDAILNSRNGVVERYQLSVLQAESLKAQLLGGLITHLRSVPLGLRISETLTLDNPELIDLEVAHVEKELNLGIEGLSQRVRESMPVEIYNLSHYINAAHAIFWGRHLEKPEIVNGYHLAGFDVHGQKLLNIYESIPNDPSYDYELIDRWAEYLQIRDWYTWVPYQAP